MWVAGSMVAVAVVLAYVGLGRNGEPGSSPNRSRNSRAALLRQPLGNAPREDHSPESKPTTPDAKKAHPLLGLADDVVLANGQAEIEAAERPGELELLTRMRTMIQGVAQAGDPASLTIDYPLDASIFPPEIVPPTFLWHEADDQADTWLIEVAWAGSSGSILVVSPGHPPQAGPIDPSCIAPSNELYTPTEYQASAKSWTPGEAVWAAIKQQSVERPASVTIFGFRSDAPGKALSRGRIWISTSRDPVGAPIFYRDVPLAPALTEKGVIKPLGEDAVAKIGWRLRDISKPESRLLLTDVPTCSNCHSFSADGTTLGMDLDGPQGDKGAYVIAPITRQTKFERKNVISWNSFPNKPAGHKTIGFLSRVSPDGQYVVTTLNEAVYVCNFMDYRFLQVFFPTRGILAYYSRATGEIKPLPGADDPNFVHCDAVWTPDGRQLVFARAVAQDPYPEDGRLARQANDPSEMQIQYDLYRIPFLDGLGGRPELIAGASGNNMSNTFPKVSPDGALAEPYVELVGEALRGRGGLSLISGWVPRDKVASLEQALREQIGERFHLTLRDPSSAERSRVPSVVEYYSWLRPFATLVRNYGVPRYGEIDPTVLFAGSFVLMFGMMFGDIGQGAVIALAGLAFWRKLRGFGPFVMSIGVSSMVFGWLYGSIFGIEHLVHPLWMSPMHDPVRMLTLALYWGIGFILFATALTVINRINEGDILGALFDGKGLAGLLFYAGAIYSLYHSFQGHFGALELAALIIPMAAILAYKWHENRGPFGERVLVVLIEGFETVMGYFANTLSFLRVAAFSLNHVALFLAVFTIANMMGTAGHWITVTIGNIFVLVLEGAIVAIQVLRLEYYEGFSRFFSGDGREFRPLRPVSRTNKSKPA